MLTSVSKWRAFGGTQALALSLLLVWPERYADAITDTVGQPLFNVGRYSGQNVASLSEALLEETTHTVATGAVDETPGSLLYTCNVSSFLNWHSAGNAIGDSFFSTSVRPSYTTFPSTSQRPVWISSTSPALIVNTKPFRLNVRFTTNTIFFTGRLR